MEENKLRIGMSEAELKLAQKMVRDRQPFE